MEINSEVVEINGRKYVPADSVEIDKFADTFDDMKYCVVRTFSAGVFAGYVQSRKGKEAVLRKARRLWFWSGASSLSQLAKEGVKNPLACKFPCEVDTIELTEVIEVIPMTDNAKKSIDEVDVWKQ